MNVIKTDRWQKQNAKKMANRMKLNEVIRLLKEAIKLLEGIKL